MHGHVRFFGELLSLLTATGAAAELTARALDFKIPAPDFRRRIGIFIGAGLVEEAGVRRFRLTPKGEAVIAELPLEDVGASPLDVSEDTTSASASAQRRRRPALLWSSGPQEVRWNQSNHAVVGQEEDQAGQTSRPSTPPRPAKPTTRSTTGLKINKPSHPRIHA